MTNKIKKKNVSDAERMNQLDGIPVRISLRSTTTVMMITAIAALNAVVNVRWTFRERGDE